MSAKKVLSVGQCAADTWSIGRMLESDIGAEMLTAGTAEEALDTLRRGGVDLVLVNRIFDMNGASGLDFIRVVKADAALKDVPIMLVSNYADAQQQAIQRGAVPGFGKAAMRTPETLQRVRDALAAAPAEKA